MSNPTVDLLLNHRSIRSFKPDRIEDDKLDLILKAGVRAATPAEMQFYSLIVVDDAETLTKLNVQSPLAIVACVDLHRHNRWTPGIYRPHCYRSACQSNNVALPIPDMVPSLRLTEHGKRV